MKENKADLKQILNSLIEKGWKPRGKYEMEYQYMLGGKEHGFYDLYFIRGHYPVRVPIKHSLRELTSKESGLWQFVCENGMVKGRIKIEDYPAPRENKKTPTYKEWTKQQRGEGKLGDCVGAYSIDNYGYRLIESSLKDESELEDFLLQNIKVDVESK